MHAHLDIAPEVADALAAKAPVVALESTLITHGLPHPRNLEVAHAMAARVRAEGAVPAIVGIVAGGIRIGLDAPALETLAAGGDVLKVSRRDLAFAVSMGRTGGTTVAATMVCAALAGIRVFATGGLGGVHRGYADTMDVSADLGELAATQVAVVCAGAKAILDLPRTLEYLETAGVPVVGYGTDDFPAFYMRSSGLPSPLRLDTPDAVARLMKTHWELGLSGGVVIAQPAPETLALDPAIIEEAVADALLAAAERGVSGKALTPFLLDRVAASTDGRSLEANAGLIENNARLAAQIAVAYCGAVV